MVCLLYRGIILHVRNIEYALSNAEKIECEEDGMNNQKICVRIRQIIIVSERGEL
jgi:hypothetical protein